MKTILLTAIGFLLLGVGAIGVVLPVLPTTPFVLLAVGCFSAVPGVQVQIMRVSFFREFIETYRHRRGLSKKTLICSLVWLWGMMILSMILTQKLWLVMLLALIGVSVTTHLALMSRSHDREGDS